MTFIIKYRRNNKEKYWEMQTNYLSDMSSLLETIFTKTTEEKIEVQITIK